MMMFNLKHNTKALHIKHLAGFLAEKYCLQIIFQGKVTYFIQLWLKAT